MGVDFLDATPGDLAAADIVAAADHDDDLRARGYDWFDLFGYPVRTFAVKTAVVLALELLAGEFEEDTFVHSAYYTHYCMVCAECMYVV